MNQYLKISIMAFTGMFVILLPISVVSQKNNIPESNEIITTVLQFYQAIEEHRCEDAIQLRPGYTKAQCQKVNEIDIINVNPLIRSKDDRAVIELKAKIRKSEKWEFWHVFLTLLKRGGHWMIVNDSYASLKKIEGLDAYLASSQYQSIDQPSISPASNLQTPMLEHAMMESPVDPMNGDDLVPEGAVPKPSPAITSQPPTVSPSTSSPLQRQELHHAASPRPGATTVLEACWGPEQLHDSLAERAISDRPTDYSPPERVYPQWSNKPLGNEWARSVRSIKPAHGEKLVALTFDLCEQANEKTGYDGKIVDILRAEKIHATFYAGGKWMRSHPKRAMQLIADPLFEIGNHAWTHGNLRVLRGEEMLEQIQWTQAQYELLRDQLLKLPCAASVAKNQAQSIPPLPTTFRFPYGTCDATALTAVAQAGLYPIQWNIVSGDPARGQTADRMVKGILGKMRPGSIVIAHANGRGWHTSEALRILIPALRKQGYRFVTVSQLLKSGTPVAVESCYEVRPGDNLRYDKLFGRGTE